jgi:hypothetical protein
MRKGRPRAGLFCAALLTAAAKKRVLDAPSSREPLPASLENAIAQTIR